MTKTALILHLPSLLKGYVIKIPQFQIEIINLYVNLVSL